MSVREKPHYTLHAATWAEWIDSQPDKWWSVDGDPLLMRTVDFPYPSDELSPMIRRVGKDLPLQDKNLNSSARGELIGGDKLDDLSDFTRQNQKILLFSWVDSGIDWLLLEDDPMV